MCKIAPTHRPHKLAMLLTAGKGVLAAGVIVSHARLLPSPGERAW